MPWAILFGMTNFFGSVLGMLGINLVKFDKDKYPDIAKENTKLSDFGEDLFGERRPSGESTFREGLTRLLASADSEAKLTTLGKIAVKQDVIRLLENRLKLVEDRKQYPEIASQEITKPFAIVSFPRTGTTLLHGILNEDPRSRTPLSWEVMYPSPPPDADIEPDPRIKKVQNQLDWFHRMTKDYQRAHPVGAELPQECIEILSPTFLSERFYRTYHVPSYVEWLDSLSLLPAYNFHKAFLQQLQYKKPGEWWVLKNPPHTFSVSELHKLYPDIRFIQTHRDPVTVFASFMSHTRKLRVAFSNHPELYQVEKTVKRWVSGMEKLMDFREKHPEIDWIDIQYNNLLADPIGEVEKIYAHHDIYLPEKTANKMKEFIKKHPQHEYGVHRYSPEEYGISEKLFGTFLEHYRKTFNVEEDQ